MLGVSAFSGKCSCTGPGPVNPRVSQRRVVERRSACRKGGRPVARHVLKSRTVERWSAGSAGLRPGPVIPVAVKSRLVGKRGADVGILFSGCWPVTQSAAKSRSSKRWIAAKGKSCTRSSASYPKRSEKSLNSERSAGSSTTAWGRSLNAFIARCWLYDCTGSVIWPERSGSSGSFGLGLPQLFRFGSTRPSGLHFETPRNFRKFRFRSSNHLQKHYFHLVIRPASVLRAVCIFSGPKL
jgi:hypothetical protein